MAPKKLMTRLEITFSASSHADFDTRKPAKPARLGGAFESVTGRG